MKLLAEQAYRQSIENLGNKIEETVANAILQGKVNCTYVTQYPIPACIIKEYTDLGYNVEVHSDYIMNDVVNWFLKISWEL